jgi:hypothetical protein
MRILIKRITKNQQRQKLSQKRVMNPYDFLFLRIIFNVTGVIKEESNKFTQNYFMEKQLVSCDKL